MEKKIKNKGEIMKEAIEVLHEYRDYVIDHQSECYWTQEENIQDAIDLLEAVQGGKTVLEVIQENL